jgi:hypothetical protein
MLLVKTEKELANAIKCNADEIEVEGDLKNHIIRIKATGKAAWGVCIGALAVVVVTLIAAPGAGIVPAAGEALAATPILGPVLGASLVPAIAIAVAGGGVGILTALRNKYKIVEKKANSIVLKRKGKG